MSCSSAAKGSRYGKSGILLSIYTLMMMMMMMKLVLPFVATTGTRGGLGSKYVSSKPAISMSGRQTALLVGLDHGPRMLKNVHARRKSLRVYLTHSAKSFQSQARTGEREAFFDSA